MNFARDVADRVVFMDEGLIVEQDGRRGSLPSRKQIAPEYSCGVFWDK